MSFTNIYYKRAVATAKSCYVCYRPTTTVLATINTVDFLYACPGHLTDSNFATRIADETSKPAVPPKEIEKIKKEWEEKQKKKAEKAQAADKEEKKKEDGKTEESPKEPAKSPSSSTVSTPGAAKAGHEKYSLHRDFYAMRQQEHKKRRQAAQAKELAPRLPGVPIGSVSAPSEESKY
ncbi:VPS4-associated protein 1 [Coprinopsis sp. MPI-PUGE-AT-0042]|nr:VPS4-associated protein 1 [Coprinopsis sp. MPI-PUGE-AT-0042]